ncbi:MAG TPA: chemotaxis protein CheA [Candidatus Saccharimonadales bacterium]|nr:chemotaxis protein CheA [Candidatus Saccharimonadales bacterium]
MDNGLSQYKDLFVQTSKEYLGALDAALLKLEKTPEDKEVIAEIFRNAHSLKGQSAAMGYEKTGYLCHAVEDVFFEIKEGHMKATPELADLLFKAFDQLSNSVAHIEADGTEIDLSADVEALKKLTGVTTVGAGKSDRANPAAPPAVTPPADTPAVIKPPAVEVKAETKPSEPASELADTAHTAAAPKIKTIPVKVEQLDQMMNLLEELIVHRLAFRRIIRELGHAELSNHQDQVEKITEALQFQIMSIRAVPVKMVFDHFPRAVRDLAREEGKQIELIIQGEDLELDRTIVERLDEPLTHIIRNAASHGIDKIGTLWLTARRERDYAIVEVADNGVGVDWAAVAEKTGVPLADRPGLKKALFSGISTAKAVTQVSGRGVGLEVVKKTIEEFGGSIDVASETGHGTKFTIRLPLTLAIAKALLVRVHDQRYAIPTASIDRSIKVAGHLIKQTAGQEAFVLEETEIPLLRLAAAFRLDTPPSANEDAATPNDALVVIVTAGDDRMGIVVDAILEVSEIIIKPVPALLKGNRAFAGATILGDGQSALIVNPGGLV